MIFIGIDISKASFYCAARDEQDELCMDFPNKVNGFKALLRWTQSLQQPCLFCMEATGVYGIALAKYLHQSGANVIVANPVATHAFVKMEMARNKTDKADAMSIARYCQHVYSQGDWQEKCFTPKSISFERLQYLVSRLEQLGKMINQENNRLLVSQDKLISRLTKATIKHLKAQVSAIEKAIKVIAKQDAKLNQQVTLLASINGIADKTAWSILAYLGDVSLFNNSKQVASYAGLTPRRLQSGTSLNLSGLSKMGNKRLRKALYMPAVVAIRRNPLMADLYNRLRERGKPAKSALCAVMRKLLVIAYGVLKSGVPFDENYAK